MATPCNVAIVCYQDVTLSASVLCNNGRRYDVNVTLMLCNIKEVQHGHCREVAVSLFVRLALSPFWRGIRDFIERKYSQS